MSSERAGSILVEHLWKRFRPDRGRMLLRDEVERLAARLRGRDDHRWRWALRDIDLRVDPGEAVGLVGVNGSGKSTLLKILCRVMHPYAGRVRVGGRVGALVEVRAGIHPDLTGRENVYLYGSLLGLPRREVAARFDEIVAFAELEDAIGRQVKFYSSGMQMRLGFAVAAFLEPDVLLVDEVLAVGDASFQQKCLDRMRTVLGQGTTLVFVSHDLAAVEAVCRRGVWMHLGGVRADGEVREVLGAYRQAIEETAESNQRVGGLVRLGKVQVTGPDQGVPRTQGPMEVALAVQSEQPRTATVHLGVSEGPASPIFLLRRDLQLTPGETQARCALPRLPLPRGRFYLWTGVVDAAGHDLLPWHPAAHFDVVGPDLELGPRAVARLASVHVEAHWQNGNS